MSESDSMDPELGPKPAETVFAPSCEAYEIAGLVAGRARWQLSERGLVPEDQNNAEEWNNMLQDELTLYRERHTTSDEDINNALTLLHQEHMHFPNPQPGVQTSTDPTQDSNDDPATTAAAQAAQARELIDRSAIIKNLRISYRNAMVLHEFHRANRIIETLADLDSEIAWEEAKDIQCRWKAGLREADAHVQHLRYDDSDTDNQKRFFSERDSPEATPTTSKALKSNISSGPSANKGRHSLGSRKSLDTAKQAKSGNKKATVKAGPNGLSGPNNFKQGDARGLTRYPLGWAVAIRVRHLWLWEESSTKRWAGQSHALGPQVAQNDRP